MCVELPEVLDGIDEPVTVEELEEVVRRAGQRRRASIVAGAAALLAVGAMGGAVVRGPADGGTRGLASEGRDTAAATTSPTWLAVPALGFDRGLTLKPLFRRESNGVAIRAYEALIPGRPTGTPECGTPHLVQAELSNGAAVGLATGTALVRPADGKLPSEDRLRVVGVGVFGAPEGEPAMWAIVQTGKDIAGVRLKVGAASDAMAPDDGKAVLVVPGTAPGGVVEALDGDGAVVASQPLDQADHIAPPPPGCIPSPCRLLPPPPPSSAPEAKAAEPSAEPAPVADPACQPACVSGGPAPTTGPPTTYAPTEKPQLVEPDVGTGSAGAPVESGSCLPHDPILPSDPGPTRATGPAPGPAPAGVTTTAPAPPGAPVADRPLSPGARGTSGTTTTARSSQTDAPASTPPTSAAP